MIQQLSTVPLPHGSCPETGQATGKFVATILGGPKHPNHPPGVVLGGYTDVIDIISGDGCAKELSENENLKRLEEEVLLRE